MNAPMSISHEVIRFNALRARLLNLYPEIDDQTLADTLEGATNLKEAIAAIIRSALEDECLVKALKARLDTLKQRLARFESRAGTKRQMALGAMQEADLPKLLEADFTASLRATPPSIAIVNEELVPADFQIAQAPKIDRRAILEALKAGEIVPGAALAASRLSLAVRSM